MFWACYDHTVEIIAFPTSAAFRSWLKKNGNNTEGIQMRLYKKNSGVKTITYDQALDEALCFGWIDGVKNSYDAESWLQKFTPRRKRSVWSKRNTEHVSRLIKEGKMTDAGQKEIEAAKADGRWERAYDSAGTMTVPEDFLTALKKHKKAFAFFQTLNKANLYAIAYRLQTAKKPETRERRMEVLLQMMKEGKKFH